MSPQSATHTRMTHPVYMEFIELLFKANLWFLKNDNNNFHLLCSISVNRYIDYIDRKRL